MKYFGVIPPRRPPDEVVELADTPVGAACAGHCGHLINARDYGVLIPLIGGPGDPPETPWHSECFLHDLGLYPCPVIGSHPAT